MIIVILIAVGLVIATVTVHAAGLAVAVRTLMKWSDAPPTRTWPIIHLILRVTWLVILVHAVEVSIWALFYYWGNCLPDAETAFYFSGVSYTSIGYGDVVLSAPWRILGPIEGLSGILMCGLSASLYFAILSRIHGARVEARSIGTPAPE
jgi:hypothetical protein